MKGILEFAGVARYGLFCPNGTVLCDLCHGPTMKFGRGGVLENYGKRYHLFELKEMLERTGGGRLWFANCGNCGSWCVVRRDVARISRLVRACWKWGRRDRLDFFDGYVEQTGGMNVGASFTTEHLCAFVTCSEEPSSFRYRLDRFCMTVASSHEALAAGEYARSYDNLNQGGVYRTILGLERCWSALSALGVDDYAGLS